MSKNLIGGLIITITLGTLGYWGYSSFKRSPVKEIAIKTSDTSAKNSDQKELDLDLNAIDPINNLAEPAVANTEPIPENPLLTSEPSQTNTNITTNDIIKREEETVSSEEYEPAAHPLDDQKTKDQAVLPVTVKNETQPPTQEKQLSREEKLEKFAKNMEGLQKQAEEEWNNMSTDEREEAEQQVAVFQENFQQEIDRLSKLSPEQIEQEKQAAMTKLERENPEAFQAVKSMEEMFTGLADAAE